MTGHDFQQTLSLLSCTAGVLNALLGNLPETWTMRNEGGNTWNVFDVLGHLVQTERADWIRRAKMILELGETRPFEPVDRFAQFRESQGKTLA
jgi:hypothetical protein